MEYKAHEGNWFKTPVSNVTRSVSVIGLDAVTVDPSTQIPYFFLFCDIDTKESETLRRILQKYERVGISAYFWETSKGWHILSPALLRLRVWTSLRLGLQDMIEFYFDTLRWSGRFGDGAVLYFEDYSRGKYQESLTMHQLLSRRFGTEPLQRGIPTVLTWTQYKQMIFKQAFPRKYCHVVQPSGAFGCLRVPSG